jgi:hypothetical protein
MIVIDAAIHIHLSQRLCREDGAAATARKVLNPRVLERLGGGDEVAEVQGQLLI